MKVFDGQTSWQTSLNEKYALAASQPSDVVRPVLQLLHSFSKVHKALTNKNFI